MRSSKDLEDLICDLRNQYEKERQSLAKKVTKTYKEFYAKPNKETNDNFETMKYLVRKKSVEIDELNKLLYALIINYSVYERSFDEARLFIDDRLACVIFNLLPDHEKANELVRRELLENLKEKIIELDNQ